MKISYHNYLTPATVFNLSDEKNPYLIPITNNFQAVFKRHDFLPINFIPELKNIGS